MKLRRENKTINGVLYVKCGTCGEFKEANADNFYRNKSLSFGLTSDCKECLHKYNKKHYDNNKEHIGKQHRERRNKNRDKLLISKKEYYNNNKQKVNDTIRNNRKKHIQELGYDRTYFHRKALSVRNDTKRKKENIGGGGIFAMNDIHDSFSL